MDERGAVALFVALMLVVFLSVAALAVDIGMQRVARTDMQSLADVVALDLARELDGRSVGELDTQMDGFAAASLARNKSAIGFEDHNPDLDVALGQLVDGKFQQMASGVPTAVEVTAATKVNFAFAGITGVEDGAASRKAVAVSQSAACFQLGSYAASIKPASAVLFGDLMEQLIGQSTVGMVGYNGLASATVSLLDVVNAPSIGVGTVDALLAMPSLTVGEFFEAMAYVLREQGQLAEAKVLDAAAASVIAPLQIDAGVLLGLSTSTDAALETRFNVLDLLVGTAFLADGDHLLLHNLQAGVPSVGVTNTQFSIIERPRRACDDDVAETAQVRLQSEAKLSLKIPLVKTPLVDLRLTDESGSPDGQTTLALDVELAGAHGRLTEVTCDPVSFSADIWTDLVRMSLTGTVRLQGDVEVQLNLGGLLGLKIVKVPVVFQLEVGTSLSKPADIQPSHIGPITYPPQRWEDPVTAGPGPMTLPYIQVSRVQGSLRTGPVTVLGIPISTSVLDAAVNPVLDGIMPLLTSAFGVVNPLVDTINGIVGPLAAGMGLTLAGADFFALPTPTCGRPALRG